MVSLNKLESELMPSIVYDSDKGVGLGYSGPIVWEDGGAHVGAVFWTKIWNGQFQPIRILIFRLG